MTEQLRTRLRLIPPGLIVAAGLALLTAILWLPFGLNVGFTGDDWIYFHQLKQGSIMSQAAPTRLLIPIPWILAYALNPGHFASINLFLALLIFAKGWLAYLILRRLNAGAALAFAAAALALIFPADSGVFYMGGLHNQFALCCYLLALYLLLVNWRTRRFSALLGLWIAQIGSIAITEQVFPLMLVTPLALLVLHPTLDRRLVRFSLRWYLVPALYALGYAALILAFPRAFAYQGSLIEQPSLSAMLTSLFAIYRRHFFDGWIAAPLAMSFAPLTLIAGALAGALCGWLRRREPSPLTSRFALTLALGGLAVVALSVVLYLPTSLRDVTLRTYYFSSVGAAVTLAAVLWWAARRPLIFAALVGVLVGLGTMQLLNQHQSFFETSKNEQAMLIALLRALPQVEPKTGIVIVDQSADQRFNHAISALDVEDIVPLIYDDDSLEGALCLPGDFGTGADARCRFTADGLVVPSVRTRYFVRPYNQLIVVRYDGQFSIADDLSAYAGAPIPAYQPERLYTPDAPLPARTVALFGL